MIREKGQHVPILDSLRAVAALSVCFYHFVCGPVNFISNRNITNLFGFGAYGVQLFFVISGFIIPWSVYYKGYMLKNYFKFLLKRFVRLEPPYIVSMILILCILLTRKYYTNVPDIRQLSLNQVLLHFGYLIPFSSYKWLLDVYWTLAIEFQFYIFMGLFYFIIISKKTALRITGYIFVLAISFIGTNKFVFYWLPVFLLGNILFLYLTMNIEKYEFYISIIVILAYIGFSMPAPIFISSLLPSLAILYLFNYSNSILNWFGKISYSIYLLHTIIGTTIINVLSHYAYSPLSKGLVIFTGLIVSIICSYCMYVFIEKPSQKLSSKIKFQN
jgi:peptidoglycan/LPS O-acetylase OafA/YrhL